MKDLLTNYERMAAITFYNLSKVSGYGWPA